MELLEDVLSTPSCKGEGSVPRATADGGKAMGAQTYTYVSKGDSSRVLFD